VSDHGEIGQPQRYCTNCGAETRPGDKFCASCGRSLVVGHTNPGQTGAGSPSGTDRRGTGAAGEGRTTARAGTGAPDPSNWSSRKFLTVVLVPLGAWLVLYAIDPALSVIVLLIAGLVALLVKLARSERASPNRRRASPNRRDWTNRETALFREFSNEVREYQDWLQRSKGWGKYRRH
jgi:hypothetical protein